MTFTEIDSSPRPAARRSTLGDLGLLALRVGVAATILQAGYLKVADYDFTVSSFEGAWQMPGLAAFMITATELLFGTMLLLGLVTPLAACALIAAMIDAWLVNVSMDVLWAAPFNIPFLLVVGLVAVLFAGPGKFSLDAAFFKRPSWPAGITIAAKVVAVLAAVATWVLLNGSNPFLFSTPAG